VKFAKKNYRSKNPFGINYALEIEIVNSTNRTLETKKGWMVKGGKKEPSTQSLYRLKGIKSADPLSEPLGRGSMDGKGGKGNHPSIYLKNTCRAKSHQ